MAILSLPEPTSASQDEKLPDLARDHWLNCLQRGYFAIKAYCLRPNLPAEGSFFDGCVVEFARAYRGAAKGTRARNVDYLAAVVIYRQAQFVGIPVLKSQVISHLPGPRPLLTFQRVLAAISKDAPRQDPRQAIARLVGAILTGISAPADVVEAAAHIMEASLDAFLFTKPPVSAAAVVVAASCVTGHNHELCMSRVASMAKVAASAVNRCLGAAAARLGTPLPMTPNKCIPTLRDLFAPGIPAPSA